MVDADGPVPRLRQPANVTLPGDAWLAIEWPDCHTIEFGNGRSVPGPGQHYFAKAAGYSRVCQPDF